MKKPYDIISTLQNRDKLSYKAAVYEFDQTKKAIQRVDTEFKGSHNQFTQKAKVLEAYLGLESDYLEAFTTKEF